MIACSDSPGFGRTRRASPASRRAASRRFLLFKTTGAGTSPVDLPKRSGRTIALKSIGYEPPPKPPRFPLPPDRPLLLLRGVVLDLRGLTLKPKLKLPTLC